MKMQSTPDIQTTPKYSSKSNAVIRRALNYAYWAFENYQIVRPSFVEKASKTVFDLLKNVRNTSIEVNCLFIYWILHEMLLSGGEIDKVRVDAGIENIIRISHYFNIEIPGATDRIAAVTSS